MSGFARFQRNRGQLAKRLDDISSEDTFHTNGLSISMHTHGDYDLQTFVDIRPLTPSPVPDVAQLFNRVKSEESALDIEFVESPSWKYVAPRTRSDGLVQTQQMLKLHANDCHFDSKLLKDNARGSIVVDWPMDNDADNNIVISGEDEAKANGSLLSNDSGLGEIELESRAPPQSSDAATYKECHSNPAFKRTIYELSAKFEAVCLWLEFELEQSKDEPAASFKEIDLLVKDFVDGRIPKLASRSSSGLIQEIAGRAFDLYAASNRPAKKTVDDYWVDVVYRVFLWDKKYQRGLVDRSEFRKLVSKEVGRTRTVNALTNSGRQRDKPAEQSTSLAGVQDRADASVIECVPSSSKSSQSSISEKVANRLPDGKEDFLSALTAGMDTIKKKLKETDGIAGNGDRIRKTTAKRSRMDATRSQPRPSPHVASNNTNSFESIIQGFDDLNKKKRKHSNNKLSSPSTSTSTAVNSTIYLDSSPPNDRPPSQPSLAASQEDGSVVVLESESTPICTKKVRDVRRLAAGCDRRAGDVLPSMASLFNDSPPPPKKVRFSDQNDVRIFDPNSFVEGPGDDGTALNREKQRLNDVPPFDKSVGNVNSQLLPL